MWEIIFIGVCIIVGSHVILRLLFGNTISSNYYKEKGYKKGYRDGSTNVKMYFTMKKTLPSVDWLDSQSGNHLDNSIKMQAALKED